MPGDSDGQDRAHNNRRRHGKVLVPILAVLGVMTVLVILSPTLYQMFCNLTGYGGAVRQVAAPTKTPADAAGDDDTVTVFFDANVAPGLPWDFKPMQRRVTTHFGEQTRVNYIAHNNSDKPIVARATFNVTPYKIAPYFFKIECFCFTEERLGPGETAEMPLVLFVDEELKNDPNANEVRQITLSYTFFEQKDLSDEEKRQARDLKAGSEQVDRKLKNRKTVEFQNDAPRD